jgi:hypothetical protein
MKGIDIKSESARGLVQRARTTAASVLGLVAMLAASGAAERTEDQAQEWRQPALRTQQPSTLSREQLLAAVEATRRTITDFQATFESVRAPAQAKMVNRERTTVVVKGDKVYIDHYVSEDADGLSYVHRTLAFNGDRTTLAESGRAVASVKDGSSDEVDTQRHEFFNLNLLNAPRRDRPAARGQGLLANLDSALSGRGRGRDDQSLVSLLRNGAATVRPLLETVAGRDCHVVDCGPFTVWLDAACGCVPLRQVYYDRASPKQILMVFLAEKTAQVAPGIWVVTRGRKILRPAAHSDVLTGGQETILFVKNWEGSSPAFRINGRVQDEFFDLWRHLPPGTELWDQDHGPTTVMTLADAATQAPQATGESRVLIRGGRDRIGGLVLLILLVGVLPTLAFWRICARAGLPRVLGLLMLVPVANVLLPLYVALAHWPALRPPRTP